MIYFVVGPILRSFRLEMFQLIRFHLFDKYKQCVFLVNM